MNVEAKSSRWLAALASALCFAGCAQNRVSPPGGNAIVLPHSARLAPYRVAEFLERRFSTETAFTNQDRMVRIEAVPGLDRDGARQFTDEGIMNIEALYANALSPYPGDISHVVVSDPRYRPRLVRTDRRGRALTYFLLFANERLGYGAATSDAVRYRSLLGWIYCERTEVLYKVRCFFPLAARPAELEEFFLSLACP